MARESTLPSVFQSLYGRVNYIRRISDNEYSSSCPYCGGLVHHNGEYPDRFRMWINSKATGGELGWCRVCGKAWTPNSKDETSVDPKTIALLQAQAKEAEEKRNEERKRKLSQFTTTELWNELHNRLGLEQREWWRKAGVPDNWQDYLRLGFTSDKTYSYLTQLLHSPAYSIPYFGFGFTFKTMQYRLCNPENPNDRYRFEAGLGTAYYMTTPSLKMGDEVIVCEGAKKGMVTKIYGEPNTTVLAVPSKVDWRGCGILEDIQNCGRVYVVFDPDCYDQPPDGKSNWLPEPIKFAKEIGNSARVIECPVKIDDAFTQYGMTDDEWFMLKKQAVKI
jgi:hypothetical protein